MKRTQAVHTLITEMSDKIAELDNLMNRLMKEIPLEEPEPLCIKCTRCIAVDAGGYLCKVSNKKINNNTAPIIDVECTEFEHGTPKTLLCTQCVHCVMPKTTNHEYFCKAYDKPLPYKQMITSCSEHVYGVPTPYIRATPHICKHCKHIKVFLNADDECEWHDGNACADLVPSKNGICTEVDWTTDYWSDQWGLK